MQSKSQTCEEDIVLTDSLLAVRSLLHPRCQEAPRSLLLSGPSDVGKSFGVRAAIRQARIRLLEVTPFDGSDRLKHILDHAPRIARCKKTKVVVFLDDIDGLCPVPIHKAQENYMDSNTAMLLSALKPLPMEYERFSSVYFIAATNRPHMVHPQILSSSCFHKHLQLELSVSLKTDISHSGSLIEYNSSIATTGFNNTCHNTVSLSSSLQFEKSKQKSTQAKNLKTSWADIGGMAGIKLRLQMAVEWPLLYPSTFIRLGLNAPRGILLHGPPGCSKTSLVKAAARSSGASFFGLSGADIFSCYLGEAERILREAFSNARRVKPSIIFLDEIDAIVGKRSPGGQVDGNRVQERVLSTLLTEMDGILSAEGVLVVGASNRIDLLDDALLRPGRFDDILEVPLPNEKERVEILRIHTNSILLDKDVDLAELASMTKGLSGADLKHMCINAGLESLREKYQNGSKESKESFHMDFGKKPETKVSTKHFLLNSNTRYY
eukprot:gb/GEZJ01000064.1/.p1 GENE.gb/GEZJ01000064.1/~~gb/GEZJ01000064.1/.p1  ORF type:complete len:493 (-),score=56.75 gb/GEZJ01000064.1/:76-1554(-)